jgi:hypothetical protein
MDRNIDLQKHRDRGRKKRVDGREEAIGRK